MIVVDHRMDLFYSNPHVGNQSFSMARLQEVPAGRGNPLELPVGKNRQEQVQARAATELTRFSFYCTAQREKKYQ